MCGGLAALALPPLHLVPLLIPAFVVLFWLLEDCDRWRGAMATGWWFGVGHFAAGFHWIALAFLVDAAQYGWMAPFAIAGLAAGMAVFPAISGVLFHGLRRRNHEATLGSVALFAVAWAALEWLRGWVLTGFPWNLMGTVWTFSDTMIQGAAWIGVYGLGALTVAVAAAPALLASTAAPRRGFVAVIALYVAFAAVAGLGAVRLYGATEQAVEGVRLRIVQPNIPQHLKWKPELKVQHVRTLLDLSNSGGVPKTSPTHVIWPETAVPFNLSRDGALQAALGDVVRGGGTLITGAPRAAPGTRDVWNSLHVVKSGGEILATYDKKHLVPFGEYVPFRGVLPLRKLTAGRIDFSPGRTSPVVSVDGLPSFAALICYEVIFPHEVDKLAAGAGWMLNLTNDAWFGHSAGPYQHLAAARIRAVEQGLPLVRAANTGISAVVDGYGRMRAVLPLGKSGLIDSDLPKKLDSPSFFAGRGASVTLALFFLLTALGVAGERRVWP